MKVLLIEDEILIQKSLAKLMKKKGAEVTCASNGAEALEHISSTNFDRIICDLMLQDVTGFDIIEDSKKFIGADQISSKFVIITAYSSDQVLKKAGDYDCPLIRKPFEDLEQALQIMLGC